MLYSLKFSVFFYIAENPKWWNKYSNIWIQKVTHIHVGLTRVSFLRNIGPRVELKTAVGPKGGTMCLDSILRTLHKTERRTCASMSLCRWKSPTLLTQLVLPLYLQAKLFLVDSPTFAWHIFDEHFQFPLLLKLHLFSCFHEHCSGKIAEGDSGTAVCQQCNQTIFHI